MPQTVVWQGTTADWPPNLSLLGRWATYAEIYKAQLWVYAIVRKLAFAHARLPLKVYVRNDKDRPEARDDPYAKLLRRPNQKHSEFFMWWWTSSTQDIYGEAFWIKVRDVGDRPAEVLPLHPTAMHVVEEIDEGVVWRYESGSVRIDRIQPRDIVHFKSYNPTTLQRGLSPLEPLRSTLENEDAARRATNAFWSNGGRPSVVLRHPKAIGETARKNITADWNAVHGGVDNWGKAAILEEGIEAQVMQLNAEELQYVESRRLNREECCAAFDMPPPAVHILDRATFSNITEQMRMLYRDTMAPRLGYFEGELEHQLREPDFRDDVYAEWLLDEVLRGAFEQRLQALEGASYLTIAEKRKVENLPFIPGTDRIFLNSAVLPLNPDGTLEPPLQRLAPGQVRSLMGRLSRQRVLAEVNPAALVAGLNGGAAHVLLAFEEAREAGEDVAGLRARIKALAS